MAIEYKRLTENELDIFIEMRINLFVYLAGKIQ